MIRTTFAIPREGENAAAHPHVLPCALLARLRIWFLLVYIKPWAIIGINPGAGCKRRIAVFLMRSGKEISSESKATSPGRPETNCETPSNSEGGRQAIEAILPLVYEELRLLAGGYLRNERPEHTLQRTALVHEAYLRLAAQPNLEWQNPAHFIGIFARLMRQTLTNYAVARNRIKRGGGDAMDLMLEFYERHQIDVTAVNESLRQLETLDPRQAQIVELRFFGGLTIEEIAELLHASPATIKREWSVAKLWLRKTLSEAS
ncbi:MAG TPA: ECF-type sigma factor [Chthoniobacterales bacterium]|jgi:RNA polymerase sigma factor (TIGR02999 family)